MASKIIDLSVNRTLLNPMFESYRLSVSPLPTYSNAIPEKVIETQLSNECYSYLHVSFVSQFNYLYDDPYNLNVVFYVSSDRSINMCKYDLTKSKLITKKVWELPLNGGSKMQSPSLSFPDTESAVIIDGDANLYILLTQNRFEGIHWTLIDCIGLTLSDSIVNVPFQLLCSEMNNYCNNYQIDLIVAHIQKGDANELTQFNNEWNNKYVCIINWITLNGTINETNNDWKIKRTRKLCASSLPNYITFDFCGCPMICIVSEKKFRFIFDSEHMIEPMAEPIDVSKETIPLYTFCQTLEDITITFKLPKDIRKDNIRVDFEPSKIEIKLNDETLLMGNLEHLIEKGTSVWTLGMCDDDYQLLEIVVNKVENGRIWRWFIENDKRGVEIFDHSTVEEILKKSAPLIMDNDNGNMNDDGEEYSQLNLEECDCVESSLTFRRYDGNTHAVTHEIHLSGHQWLCTVPALKSHSCDGIELPCFVIRHDVDALVWRPQSFPDITQFKVEHISTFSAFGYVQASKQNRRFIVSSDNFSFVAIADGSRHLYVYRQPSPIQCDLRNRKTGKDIQNVANQYVINLNDCDSIIGIKATDESIFVLGSNKIYIIKIIENELISI